METRPATTRGILALLSDFGLQDVYVGVMKAAIAQINPQLTIIDITHQIPPQNIAAGRFCLLSAYAYLPPKTVCVAVVDPGVGTDRRGVAVEIEDRCFVAPDNGLLSGILQHSEAIAAVQLDRPDYWRTASPSATFHGRDIFAPVGAHLANGVPLEKVGTAIDPRSLIRWQIPPLKSTPTEICGCIQYIDRFGNLVSNIPAASVAGKSWALKWQEKKIPSGHTYSDRAVGELIALIGSHGWVEIAVSQELTAKSSGL
ncbi:MULTISPECIES: SAM-dependent chlorinase/fluorinase [Spirulina sp. CCY15215]|uniref:SAM hydrolase/SAM-dependent halogenase family protein n=1 Tax=Spirulina sp. CCY15215 TaxID=2767591 RepID=UPI001951DA0E|nr:SAM-dependent chlorinase/fluorinase [Spirulina major]